MLNRLLRGWNLLVIALLVSGFSLFLFIIAPTGLPEISSDGLTKIYFADNISPAHQKVIDQFNQRYLGSIKVVPINLPFTKFSTNERKQLLTRSLRTKSSRIDIFAVDLIWIPRFIKWAEPLSAHFSPEEQENMLKHALDACHVDGELYGVPLYIDVGLMYYRQDLLSLLPDFEEIENNLQRSITWEEFINLHQRLAFLNKPFYVFPADNYEGLMCSFVETLAGQKSGLLADESVLLNTPEARRGLGLLVDLVNKYKLTPPAVTEFREVDAYEYSLKNDAIFFRGWPGNLKGYANAYPDKIQNIRVGPLPHFKEHAPAAVFGGWSLMISHHSTKKAAAIQFLKFAASVEMQKIFFSEMGYLPANNQVYQDSSFLEAYPELRDYRRYLDLGFHRPAVADYTKISDVISYYMKLAIKKELPVSEALMKATEQVHSKKVLIP